MQSLSGKNILLIISGGIAAYKSLELIRLLKKADAAVRCILTKGGAEFVTPLSVAALSEHPVYTNLWSLKDETEMGHIRLAREADLVVIAPASANMIAKMAHGLADDLASTLLLANDKPVLLCPAMNPVMWNNPATQSNVRLLAQRGIKVYQPSSGEMACGEIGEGRLPEAAEIFTRIQAHFDTPRPLSGLTALVTAGPTYEPLDPVRFIGNRSSGKQGFAIAEALANAGATVTLVTGPSSLAAGKNINLIRVETANNMLEQCEKSLPADIAVFCAAVADWKPEHYATSKIKKKSDSDFSVQMKRNVDILSTISSTGYPQRPALVIGFAAETDDLATNAVSKRERKNCDWLLANLVEETNSVFGSDQNQVLFVDKQGTEDWPRLTKTETAQELVLRISDHFSKET